MYTQAEINKAIKVWKETLSLKKTVRILGYPCRRVLRKWVREFKQKGKVRLTRYSKFSQEQKRLALKLVIQKSWSVPRVTRHLGYPSITLLRMWLKEYRLKHPSVATSIPRVMKPRKRHSEQEKLAAVREFRNAQSTGIAVARKFGISRQTLYAWDREFPRDAVQLKGLSMPRSKVSKAQPRKPPTADNLEAALLKVAQLEKQVSMLVAESDELQKQVEYLKMQKDALVKAAELLKKDGGINLEALSNKEKTLLIDALRNSYKLKDLLVLFKLPKSSYCYQHNVINSPDKYQEVREIVKQTFTENYRCYGYRRVWYSLRNNGIRISEKVVRRLMRQEGLHVYYPRRKKFSSYRGEISPAVPNLLQRNFHAQMPNEKWLTDITEFLLPTGKVYLSVLVECYDGNVVAWSSSTSPTADLANSMLRKALQTLKPEEHPIIHSDRGFHYQWPEWIRLMESHGLTRSMSRKGCSPDNSACEGFFGRMKNEMFYGRDWSTTTPEEFITCIDQYMHWFREKRIKITLDGLSPNEFRSKHGILSTASIN